MTLSVKQWPVTCVLDPPINGCHFKILLHAFKVAQLTSFKTENSWIFNSKTRLVGLILILTNKFLIGSHLCIGSKEQNVLISQSQIACVLSLAVLSNFEGAKKASPICGLALKLLKVLLWSNSRYPFFYIFVHNRSSWTYFREFTAAINFPCSKSGLRIGENDVIFSKKPHGLKL